MAELKPCPFCGSIPYVCVNKYRHEQSAYCVKCSNIDCDIVPTTYEFLDVTQAISHWNKRTDVEGIKHGEWYLLKNCANEGVYCSVCRKKVYKTNYTNQKIKSPFCPNCGAKMDKKEGAEG